jgi:hypothetical protein
MIFFRVVLCLIGLLLYLVIKEFSAQPETVAGQDALRPVPVVDEDPRRAASPWQPGSPAAFHPVSEVRTAEALR